MKYLILFALLLFISSCRTPPSCFELTGEDVTVEVEVKHNLSGENIAPGDTLKLSITFPESLVNTKTGGTFDITPHEPSFALFIRDREATRHTNRSPLILSPAKDAFRYDLIEGEELQISYYLLAKEKEAINIRPKLSQGQYSLKIHFYIPQSTGSYLMHWNYLHRDFLLLDGEKSEERPGCTNLIKVKINNSGNANVHLASDNPSITENPDLVKEFGLFLFNLGN